MKISETRIILVPGIGETGPDHWLSRWQSKLATAHRVHASPDHAHDVAALQKAVANERALPVVLVCHALGCSAALRAAHGFVQGRVRGAFLVAPPSDAFLHRQATGFAPIPHTKLPFPAVLIASRNDPAAVYSGSEALASALGASFVDAGEAGGLDSEAGFGPWPEGLMRFGAFLRSLGPASVA